MMYTTIWFREKEEDFCRVTQHGSFMGYNCQALLVRPLTLPLSASQYMKAAIWLLYVNGEPIHEGSSGMQTMLHDVFPMHNIQVDVGGCGSRDQNCKCVLVIL
jgi:hypothetical protein